ncbi:hypothetical protein BDZ94DRAFT_1245431 [Collybia nuda]|uniref:Uncharacterized protein n=1 Tax=Collybia nuda TaxID=64659 RepID=A0A9P5YH14_9AGAR|nr:hypothetical protein BDZ94DRAFT_1245431 [Collybia nuda]
MQARASGAWLRLLKSQARPQASTKPSHVEGFEGPGPHITISNCKKLITPLIPSFIPTDSNSCYLCRATLLARCQWQVS